VILIRNDAIGVATKHTKGTKRKDYAVNQ
jgi:hypothetical protein